MLLLEPRLHPDSPSSGLDCLSSAFGESPGEAETLPLIPEVVSIVATGSALRPMLQRCAESVLRGLGAASARIWTIDDEGHLLFPQASAGNCLEGERWFDHWRSEGLRISRVLRGQHPFVTNDAANDTTLEDRDWFGQERIVAFAAYPLVVDGGSVGAMAVYTRQRLSDQCLQALAAVADVLAVGVRWKRDEEAREELSRQIHEQQDRDGLRERLLGIVGHELRSPLLVITMAAAVISERGDLSDRDARSVTLIRRSADRMTGMVHQLLDFTRVRLGGGSALTRAEADLVEIAREIVAELELSHPGRVFVVAASGSAVGYWDRTRLGQVIANLLSNAVQYGDPDRPVSLTVNGDGERVALSVHNDGSPIPAEALPYIFDPFRRARLHQADRRGGATSNLGLGLYILGEIVSAHGGSVRVSSAEEDGTTFQVELPRQ